MRLVCEQCSAGYTIEDDLVGGRDFRVSCKQCGTPIVVKHDRDPNLPPSSGGQQTTASGSAPTSSLSARPPRPPATFAPTGHEEWFVWIAGGQRGPMPANQVAALIEQGDMDWATQVWRDGFKDWRAARRDATLVTAVAGARGGAGDTMRLNAARSFLAPEDTIVEARPDILTSPSQRVSVVSEHDLLMSSSDTQALDARDMPQLAESLRPAARPSPPPQQWNSPENAAFRAGLGLPADTQTIRRPSSLRPGPQGPLAEAFRSTPGLLRSQPPEGSPSDVPVTGHDARETWLPKPQSLLAVAALAFAGGVLAAAIVSKLLVSPKAPVEQKTAAAQETLAPKGEPSPASAPLKAPELTLKPIVAPVLRELPEQDELRRAVRKVSPEVRRCILDPVAGVDVGVFIDGASGRVRDVDVRSAGLTPGRVDCVIHAVRQVQVAPFQRPEVKLEHRFSW